MIRSDHRYHFQKCGSAVHSKLKTVPSWRRCKINRMTTLVIILVNHENIYFLKIYTYWAYSLWYLLQFVISQTDTMVWISITALLPDGRGTEILHYLGCTGSVDFNTLMFNRLWIWVWLCSQLCSVRRFLVCHTVYWSVLQHCCQMAEAPNYYPIVAHGGKRKTIDCWP